MKEQKALDKAKAMAKSLGGDWQSSADGMDSDWYPCIYLPDRTISIHQTKQYGKTEYVATLTCGKYDLPYDTAYGSTPRIALNNLISFCKDKVVKYNQVIEKLDAI